jgi:ribosome biogenesis protein ENP2
MIYQPYSCDLIAVGATNEIYRLNLDLGRFNSPLVSDSPELNCVDFSHELKLIAVGGIDGKVEFWNMDNRSKVYTLNPTGMGISEEIKSIKFE